MGDWNLNIQGGGAHHNDRAEVDIDRLASEFVKKIKEAGQTVISATLTYGGAQEIGK